jgi:hypothetical protein
MKLPWLYFLLGAIVFLENSAVGDPAGSPNHAPPCTQLADQFEQIRSLCFPAKNLTLLTMADRKGSEEVAGWIESLKPLYAGRVDFWGLANVAGVPGFLQPKVRRKFQETRRYPVMLDWSGDVCGQFGCQGSVANLLVIDRSGVILFRICGPATSARLASVRAAIDAALASQ